MTATAGISPLLAAETTVADALEDAATRWTAGQRIPFLVRRLAAPAARHDLPVLWAEFCGRTRMRDDLGTGVMPWQDAYPDLTCAGRQEAAFQLAAAEADEARNAIQHGPRGTAS